MDIISQKRKVSMKPKDFAKVQAELESKFTQETVEDIKTGKVNQEELTVLEKIRKFDLQEYNEAIQLLQPHFEKYSLEANFGLYDSTITIDFSLKNQNKIVSFKGLHHMKDLPRQMMYCKMKTDYINQIKEVGTELSNNVDIIKQLQEINDKFIKQYNFSKKEKLIIDNLQQKAIRFHLKERMTKK